MVLLLVGANGDQQVTFSGSHRPTRHGRIDEADSLLFELCGNFLNRDDPDGGGEQYCGACLHDRRHPSLAIQHVVELFAAPHGDEDDVGITARFARGYRLGHPSLGRKIHAVGGNVVPDHIKLVGEPCCHFEAHRTKAYYCNLHSSLL